MAEQDQILSEAMPSAATFPDEPEYIRSYQQISGIDFPYYSYAIVPRSPEHMDPSTHEGRAEIRKRADGMSRFLRSTSDDFVARSRAKIEEASLSGRDVEIEGIEAGMGSFLEQLEKQDWIVSAMDMLDKPGAWESLPMESRDFLYKRLGLKGIPVSQQEPISSAAVPGTNPQEKSFMQLLTPVQSPVMQRRSKYRAGVASDVIDKYGKEIATAAHRHGVDPLLMAVQIAQESLGDPTAISHADAVGLTQFISATWNHYMPENPIPRAMQGEPSDKRGYLQGTSADPRLNPALATEAQARYLKDLISKHSGNVAAAISEYNAGPWALRQAVTGRRPFRDETMNYYPSILLAYQTLASERPSFMRTLDLAFEEGP